jgi:hypothetical protein
MSAKSRALELEHESGQLLNPLGGMFPSDLELKSFEDSLEEPVRKHPQIAKLVKLALVSRTMQSHQP